jgi:hypothetical protein
MAKTKSGGKNVFDVARPGASPSDPTARPIITGHGQMLKDPMVSEPPAKERLAGGPLKVIKPVELKSEPSATASRGDKVAETALAEPAATSLNDQIGVAGGLAGQEIAGDGAAGGPMKAELARRQLVEELVAAETYFLPIGQVTRRRRLHRAIVVLFVASLLILAGSYLVWIFGAGAFWRVG